jgi:inner membrane protein
MEPVTHFLTGACIGRAGLNRKTAYATLAAVLASEAADLDILWALGGPVEELKHHRGITHTFIAAPVAAGVVVGAVWLLHRWREGRRRRRLAVSAQVGDRAIPPLAQKCQTAGPSTPVAAATSAQDDSGKDGAPSILGNPARCLLQPVRWGWLYLTALIASLSHLLLDWANNYGLRPFFPFNPRWYAGSFVFIAEPVMLGLLLPALIAPWLLGLADGEIGARRKQFRGRGWAIIALTGMVVLGCWRWAEQAQARAMAENTQIAAAPVKRMVLEPYPVNPFRWHAILETAEYYQTAEIDTRTGSIESDPRRDVLFKPPSTAAVEAAKGTPLGQVYLDWGTWAVVRDVGEEPVAGMDPPHLPPNRQWTTVEFTDLRFAYSFLGTGRAAGRSPLSGWVYIVDGRDDTGELLNGREQR